jgi:hypothetical protein
MGDMDVWGCIRSLRLEGYVIAFRDNDIDDPAEPNDGDGFRARAASQIR